MKKIFKTIITIIKKIKIRTLIILIVLLVFNSYAWFIYATRVSATLTAHIASWDVEFVVGETNLSNQVNFNVETIYPGMETFTQTVTINNKGEVNALLTYQVNLVRILGTTYQVGETYTSEDLLNIIQNNYPFTIEIETNNDELSAGSGTRNF